MITTISSTSPLSPPDPFQSLPPEGQYPATTFPNPTIHKSSPRWALIFASVALGIVLLVIIGFGMIILCSYFSPPAAENRVVGVPVVLHQGAAPADDGGV
ncbi:hypothetical protein A2U01_0071686 [Trifolium medium]|uniref:Uncharacterized protein n=1 Tax=Trifolium medium TaxID=97028 RepID=A0A392SPU5_9FABA|nr:hypothetical protein [Trifolium medium]